MSCFKRPQVYPSDDNSFVRLNGWTKPFHKLQIASWIVLSYIAFIHFAVLALAVERQLWPASYVCVGFVFFVHIALVIWATFVDPGDDSSIERIKNSNKALPVFDRSVHSHVIENNYCHICEVAVAPLSKHCLACNKCVAVFDHHCRWLNNCIGEKNYRIFIATLVSGLVAILAMLVLAVFVFVNAVQDFRGLYSDVWWNSSLPTRIAFLVLIGICIVLLITSFFLLGHLLGFHIALMKKNLTTYEYIKRKMASEEKSEAAPESARSTPLPDVEGVCNDTDVAEAKSIASNGKNTFMQTNLNGW